MKLIECLPLSVVLATLALAGISRVASGSTLSTPKAATKPSPKVTLQECLQGIHDPDHVPLVVVRAREQRVFRKAFGDHGLPSDLKQVQSVFHLMHKRIGTVSALVPTTKTELSIDFPPIDMDAQSQPDSNFPLLAAALDNRQWSTLTSAMGLGYADLTTADQRRLWNLYFHGPDKLVLQRVVNQSTGPDRPQVGVDLTHKKHSIRIRFQRTVGFYLSGPQHNMLEPERQPGSQPLYELNYMAESVQNNRPNYPLKVSPNTQKATDLRFEEVRLNGRITVSADSTVGGLVKQIATESGVRLYCSPAFERYSVHVIDAKRSIRCGDLLQALCLSLTGTIRGVGPDFALTNDIVGFGTKLAIVDEYKDRKNQTGGVLYSAATQKLSVTHPPETLPLGNEAGDVLPPTEFTDAQRKLAKESLSADFGVAPDYTIDISRLTPQQLANLRSNYTNELGADGSPQNVVTGFHEVYVFPHICVTVQVPGIEGAVRTPDGNFGYIYNTSVANQAEQQRKQQDGFGILMDQKGVLQRTVLTPFRAILAQVPDRAILVSSNNVSDTLEMLSLAKKLGFNHLWLDVFAGTFDKPDAEREARHLHEADLVGKQLGVQVSPVIDILHTTDENPAHGLDVNVLGETPLQQSRRISRWYSGKGLTLPRFTEQSSLNGLTPAGDSILNRIRNIKNALKQWPELSTPVLVDAGMPGYYMSNYGDDHDLGYSLSNRVAFLEKTHVDPIDISSLDYRAMSETLPLFSVRDYELGPDIMSLWDNFRFVKLNQYLEALTTSFGPELEPGLPKSNMEDGGIRYFPAGPARPSIRKYQFGHKAEFDAGDDYRSPVSDPGPHESAEQARFCAQYSYAVVDESDGNDLYSITGEANQELRHQAWKGVVLNLDPHLDSHGELTGTSLETLRALDKKLAESEHAKNLTNAGK